MAAIPDIGDEIVSKATVRVVSSIALAFAASLPVAAAAAAVEPCLATAASEYGIPTRILDAMRAASVEDAPKNTAAAAGEFGSMRLGEPTIRIGAKAIGISAERAKSEACASYRVAAWLLDQKRQDAGGDLWMGLRAYRVGNSKTATATAIGDQYVATIKSLAGER